MNDITAMLQHVISIHVPKRKVEGQTFFTIRGARPQKFHGLIQKPTMGAVLA